MLSVQKPPTAVQVIRCLALDDDAIDLKKLQRAAKRSSFDLQVEGFTKPRPFLERLAGPEVDVLLLDQHLGRTTGLAVLDRVREMGWSGPVLLMTGAGDEELAIKAFRAGIADYLWKDDLTEAAVERAICNAHEKWVLRSEIVRHEAELEVSVKELERINREIRGFYHSLSHELKTPLTSIREFVSLAVDGVCGELTEATQGVLEKALRNCDHLVVQMNDILDATRLETGKLDLHKSPTIVDDVVKLVASDHATGCAERGVELRVELPDEPIVASVDETRLFQIVSNLLGNAIKFTPSGGSVTVSLHRSEMERFAVRVADTGRGIAQDQLELIFDRLHQTEDDDAAIKGGLGIGLYLCKELAALHGGCVTVDSQPDVGSTFSALLPI